MPDIIEAVRAGLAPHYTVEREIGAGGMARVFLAAERHPPRMVAIKVMNPGFSSPAFRARFTREIELTRGLSHPHIVPILAAQECLFVPASPDDLCYYVMPYVEGESLRQRLLREKRLPLADALRISREVGDALRFRPHAADHSDARRARGARRRARRGPELARRECGHAGGSGPARRLLRREQHRRAPRRSAHGGPM